MRGNINIVLLMHSLRSLHSTVCPGIHRLATNLYGLDTITNRNPFPKPRLGLRVAKACKRGADGVLAAKMMQRLCGIARTLFPKYRKCYERFTNTLSQVY